MSVIFYRTLTAHAAGFETGPRNIRPQQVLYRHRRAPDAASAAHPAHGNPSALNDYGEEEMHATTVHPCDERLPAARLLTLGFQHVLVMYAGAIAVPLIVGSALKLPKEQIAFLISADLFACGIATLIQTLGIGMFGIRLPIIMGCTFTAVSPMIAIGADPRLGLLDIFGSTLSARGIGL